MRTGYKRLSIGVKEYGSKGISPDESGFRCAQEGVRRKEEGGRGFFEKKVVAGRVGSGYCCGRGIACRDFGQLRIFSDRITGSVLAVLRRDRLTGICLRIGDSGLGFVGRSVRK